MNYIKKLKLTYFSLKLKIKDWIYNIYPDKNRICPFCKQILIKQSKYKWYFDDSYFCMANHFQIHITAGNIEAVFYKIGEYDVKWFDTINGKNVELLINSPYLLPIINIPISKDNLEKLTLEQAENKIKTYLIFQ